MVDTERGGFAAECVAVDAAAMDIGRQDEVKEGGQEAYVQKTRFAQNRVKILFCFIELVL
jgi:hypothetical protein